MNTSVTLTGREAKLMGLQQKADRIKHQIAATMFGALYADDLNMAKKVQSLTSDLIEVYAMINVEIHYA
jgi:hypothetical protein